MNIPIFVYAYFNLLGEITPRHVQLEDEKTHELSLYKVDVEYSKEEIHVGIATILFCCFIERNGCLERIKIRFHKATTQWVLVK
jgi:hypothetical protein